MRHYNNFVFAKFHSLSHFLITGGWENVQAMLLMLVIARTRVTQSNILPFSHVENYVGSDEIFFRFVLPFSFPC